MQASRFRGSVAWKRECRRIGTGARERPTCCGHLSSPKFLPSRLHVWEVRSNPGRMSFRHLEHGLATSESTWLLGGAHRSQPAYLHPYAQMVNIKREDFAKTVFRVNRFAESGIAHTYQIEAVHPVPCLQVIFKKEKIGQRRRKVVHLNLGRQLPKSQIVEFMEQLGSCLFMSEFLFCQRAVINHR